MIMIAGEHRGTINREGLKSKVSATSVTSHGVRTFVLIKVQVHVQKHLVLWRLTAASTLANGSPITGADRRYGSVLWWVPWYLPVLWVKPFASMISYDSQHNLWTSASQAQLFFTSWWFQAAWTHALASTSSTNVWSVNQFRGMFQVISTFPAKLEHSQQSWM